MRGFAKFLLTICFLGVGGYWSMWFLARESYWFWMYPRDVNAVPYRLAEFDWPTRISGYGQFKRENGKLILQESHLHDQDIFVVDDNMLRAFPEACIDKVGFFAAVVGPAWPWSDQREASRFAFFVMPKDRHPDLDPSLRRYGVHIVCWLDVPISALP